MKRAMLPVLAIAVLAAPVLPRAAHAQWIVEKNEPDPFDSTRSTFIAAETFDGGIVALRCLEGQVSMVLIVEGSTDAAPGDRVPFQLVADGKPVRAETASIISANELDATIEFGDEDTVEYLKAVAKVSVRYVLGHSLVTRSFAGGRSLTVAAARALRACAAEPPTAAQQAPPRASAAPPIVSAPRFPPPPAADDDIQFRPYTFSDQDRRALFLAGLRERFCSARGEVDALIDKMLRETTGFNHSDMAAAKAIAAGANAVTPALGKSVARCGAPSSAGGIY